MNEWKERGVGGGGTRLSRRSFVAGSAVMAFGALTGLAGCAAGSAGEGPSAQSSGQPADMVFRNGHVQTMVDEGDVAQAVAVRGNEIVYVGDDAGVEEFVGDTTKVIDLDGAFLSPGFMDGHIHAPGTWLDRLFNVYLEGMETNDEYLAAIRQFVEEHPEMDAYFGRPFMLNAYQRPDGSNPGPNKADLDAICPDKPVVITDVSGHSAWVNSKALEMAGITRDTPNPEGGVVYRSEDGEPSGCVADAAYDLVSAAVPSVVTFEQMEEAMEKFMEEANSYGITGITNVTRGGLDINELYHRLDEEGRLKLRMRVVTTMDPLYSYDEVLAAIKDSARYDSDMVTTQTVKIFYDGVTESGTAVMLEPYLPESGLGDDWRGEPIWPVDQFDAMVSDFDAEGIQVHVHAIGDGAVRGTLDAYEKAQAANGKRDARHTMTHVCAIADDDIARMADMDVIGAMQFLWMYGDSLYELEKAYIGEERALAMYPTKRMRDAGVLISGASDAPVTAYVSLDEIETGVTRNSPYAEEEATDMHRWPEQGLSAYQMLEAYTKNVAYQNFMEDIVGTVEVGKRADLVVLDQNILEVDPEKISDSKVLYTVSDGRIVYEG
ncbi:amidohydrolase [Gordonibacter sp. An230]|uniref:amidohydrolase n=1 Tax=Gordonibacter sp. An230 TaxID=1965592 RepID=UPI000B54ADEB|nr:amidohydrolase [Gordonibacter sp. An230]OUO87549.1 amidohydrolase [Gordonibacter sp. An230]